MISAVVLTKNEENKITTCLERLLWCSEIIVIDDNSSDKTVFKARRMGAKVYRRSLDNDFSAQRNFGLKKARNEWVVFVDADEIVTEELSKEIMTVLQNPQAEGYFIKRQDIFMGKKMHGGEWGRNWLLRLGKGGEWSRKVHEQWKIPGKVGRLSSTLLHSPDQSLEGFVARLNHYSSLHAESNSEEGKSADLIKITCYPLIKFFDNFFVKGGWRDGVYGFVYAILMSFHSFLAWSKLWTSQ